MMPLRALALGLAFSLAACSRGDTLRTAVSDTTQSALRIDPATTAGATALELWQLRPGVTWGDWRAAHPDESVTGADTSAVARAAGDFCAAAQRLVRVGQRVLVRTAFFYPPEPGNLELPDSGARLLDGCLLGMAWVAIPVADSGTGTLLADSVHEQLNLAVGGLTGGPVHFFGSAYWSQVSRFRRGQLTAVTALKNPVPQADSAGRRMVIAFAYLPNSALGTGDDAPVVRGPWQPPDSLPLDSVMDQSGLAAPLRASLDSVLRLETDSLARVLRRWLRASEGRPFPQRAAALYVADQVLLRHLCDVVACGEQAPAALAPLRALGAEFTWSELGATWVYQRTWLNQARTLDRDSPLGQRILLAQMGAAFDFSGTCEGGAEGFRRVIENGERYLARLPGSPVAAEVHFLVGEAWRDIVALAHGAGDIYADSSRYGAEAGPAAARALEHYRAALTAGPSSETARAAWRQAWRLRAGMAPRDVRFYCVYD